LLSSSAYIGSLSSSYSFYYSELSPFPFLLNKVLCILVKRPWVAGTFVIMGGPKRLTEFDDGLAKILGWAYDCKLFEFDDVEANKPPELLDLNISEGLGLLLLNKLPGFSIALELFKPKADVDF